MSGATAVKHAAVETDGDLGLVWSALKGNVMDQRHKQRVATKILAQVINCALEDAMICLVVDPLLGSRRQLLKLEPPSISILHDVDALVECHGEIIAVY